LAGDLAKVQPLLQRLHVVEKPKKRFGGRNVILVIGAVALVLAAVAIRFRLRGRDGVVSGEDDVQAESPIEDAAPTDYALPIEDALPTTG
jgi:hypothetical protein